MITITLPKRFHDIFGEISVNHRKIGITTMLASVNPRKWRGKNRACIANISRKMDAYNNMDNLLT
jgi:hypothetical protein